MRDLALFRLALSTMLRSSDLVSLRVEDVLERDGSVAERMAFTQQKTGKPVRVNISKPAREALQALITEEHKAPADFLFTGKSGPWSSHISTRTFRDLVKAWATLAKLDASKYAGHSTRRTGSSHVYKRTGNLEAVRQLLGQSSIASTQAYLGIDEEEALRIGEKFGL